MCECVSVSVCVRVCVCVFAALQCTRPNLLFVKGLGHVKRCEHQHRRFVPKGTEQQNQSVREMEARASERKGEGEFANNTFHRSNAYFLVSASPSAIKGRERTLYRRTRRW